MALTPAVPLGGTKWSDFRALLALEFWLRMPMYLLFFLMLVFPMVIELLYVKALLFAVGLFLVGLSATREGKLTLHPVVALWALGL